MEAKGREEVGKDGVSSSTLAMLVAYRVFDAPDLIRAIDKYTQNGLDATCGSCLYTLSKVRVCALALAKKST